IGVFGDYEVIENSPVASPGVLMEPPPIRAAEYFLRRGLESMGIKAPAMRAAILTRPLDDRPSCFYATACERGCPIRANFQTPTVLIPPARATGNLDLRADAQVYQVDMGNDGRAKGVSFVDRKTGQHHSIKARAVVLAASACESARILLNSAGPGHPQGLCND